MTVPSYPFAVVCPKIVNLFKRQSAQSNPLDDQPSWWRSPPLINPDSYDPVFHAELLRLHAFNVCGRWVFVIGLWLVVGSVSLWWLWPAIELMLDHFTWAALRYGLAFRPLAALGLAICVGPTTGLLFWQSRNILLGLPKQDVKRLEKTVNKIREQGKSHPLWRWVCEAKHEAGQPSKTVNSPSSATDSTQCHSEHSYENQKQPPRQHEEPTDSRSKDWTREHDSASEHSPRSPRAPGDSFSPEADSKDEESE